MTPNIIRHLYEYLWAFAKRFQSFFNMRSFLSRFMHGVLLSDTLPRAMSSTESHARRMMVVGLGNQGMQGTRHNVGMAVVGALATRLDVADGWRGNKQVSGEVIVSQVEQTYLVLLRPKLLMNVNGASVAKAASKFGVRPEDVLLIHDDLDKPLGKISIKQGGSARGHNGVRSCIDCLQTDVMPRVRVGIGRPQERNMVERWVLGRFSAEEKKLLDSVLERSVDLVLSQLREPDAQSPASPAGRSRARQRSSERQTEEMNQSM